MAYLRQNDSASTRYPLSADRVTIGRDPDNDIVLSNDMHVSRLHAELELRDKQWMLRDNQSRNGTFVNGLRINKVPLRNGDRVVLGGAAFDFSAEDDPLATIADAEDADSQSDLSAREQEVLALLAGGATDQEIAGAMFISLSTVRSHLDRIRDKTGCRRRPELTRLALEKGLLN
jgi:pSer/pThr/pTyr-binding forkhead associated (FHA) protein